MSASPRPPASPPPASAYPPASASSAAASESRTRGRIATVRDAEFFAAFRMATPDAPLDRLTLLACDRQGLLPQDLEYRPIDLFRERNAAPLIAETKYERREVRRRQFLRIVLAVRQEIVDMLRTVSATGRLSHEQAKLHALLLEQPPSSVSNDAQESDLIAGILLRQSDRQAQKDRVEAAIARTQQEGANEVHKIRRRQLASIVHDLRLERERQALLVQMQKNEEEFKEQRATAVLIKKIENARAAEQRDSMVEALQRRNEEAYWAKKRRLEEQQRRQEEIQQRLRREREATHAAKLEQSEVRMCHVKEQAARVREEEASQCELLRHELDAKQGLHVRRRENLGLRFESLRAARQANETVKYRHVAEHLTHVNDHLQGMDAEARRRLDEAAERKRQHDADVAQRLREAALVRAREQAITARNRALREAQREARREEQRQEEREKAERLARLVAQKALEQTLRRELNHVRHEEHADNATRLSRLASSEQHLKDALLAEDQHFEELQQAHRDEAARKLQIARQRIAEERERMETRMIALRAKAQTAEHAERLVEKEMRSGGNYDRSPAASASRSRARGGEEGVVTAAHREAASSSPLDASASRVRLAASAGSTFGGGSAARPATCSGPGGPMPTGAGPTDGRSGELRADDTATPLKALIAQLRPKTALP